MESERTPKQPCGCVDNTGLSYSDGRFAQSCIAHTLPRFVSPSVRRDSAWYVENCCPFCGRVNSTGCACRESWTITCDTCGLHTCERLEMAHYSLRQKLGLICPSTINRRTKAGKADLQTLAAHPERNA